MLPSEVQRPRLVTQAIIQDALVLRMGDFGAGQAAGDRADCRPPNPDATASAPPPPTSTPLPPDIMTLVVSPQDSLVLNYINRIVERYPSAVVVSLALRSAGDTSRVDTESVTLAVHVREVQYCTAGQAQLRCGPVRAGAGQIETRSIYGTITLGRIFGY